MKKKKFPSVCPSVCHHDNSSKSEPILMNLFLKDFDFIFVRLSSKMSKIGSLDPEIWAKKWSKSGQIEVSQRFFEKISRNMTDTEKMMLTDIIGNFVADNIVFEVSKIDPVDPEIWPKKVVNITETRIS